MGCNSSKMDEEMAQLRRDMMAEEMAQLRMEMMAERKAQLRRERRAERRAQLFMERMAKEMAQLRTEIRPLVDLQTSHARMAEEIAQLRMEMMSMGRPDSPDSDLSLNSDWSKEEPIDFKDRVSPRPDDLIGPDIDHVGDHDDLMVKRMLESIDSGVSFKSDRSKEDVTNFKDRVSPSGLDFSSSVKKHVVSDDDGFFESPDDLEEMNQELSSEVGWKHG